MRSHLRHCEPLPQVAGRNQQIKKMIPPYDRPRMDRVVAELRHNDLSCQDIATVISLYEPYEVTRWQVVEWVKRLGLTGQHPKARRQAVG